MIEIYSNNVTVGENGSIPLNIVSLVKGTTAIANGNSISLNRCGVYEITVDGSVTIPTGTTVEVQMMKDGVAQPQARTTITSTADNVIPFSFQTLVQVTENNTPCPCSAPTNIAFVSSTETTYQHFNVTVSKLV